MRFILFLFISLLISLLSQTPCFANSLTTVRDGNWNDTNPATTPWASLTGSGVGGVPGAGDTVTITNNVTMTSDNTIGDGTVSTNAILCASGSLTITGCKLSLRGAAEFDSAGGGHVDGLIVNSNGSTQAGVEFDSNSGVAPCILQSNYVGIVANGTSSGHCYFRTKSGSAGNNGYIQSTLPEVWLAGGYWYAQYTDFTALGNSATPAIQSSFLGGGGTFVFNYCTFTNCGPVEGGFDSATLNDDTEITNCTWITPASNDLILGFGNPINTSAREVRKMDRCVFANAVYIACATDFTITNCYFPNGFNCASSQLPWASMDGCFIHSVPITGDAQVLAGGMSNCYNYITAAGTGGFIMDQYGNLTVDGANGTGGNIFNNVIEYTGSGLICAWGGGEEPPEGILRPYAVKGNISFSSGPGTLYFASIGSNTNNILNNVWTVEHNTIITKAFNAILGQNPGITQSLKSNIFYNIGSSSATSYFCPVGIMGFMNTSPEWGNDPPVIVDTSVAATAISNNCWLNYATSPAGYWSYVAGDTGVEDGTIYSSPMSGSIHPGVNDLPSTNPMFVDPTRNLAKWDRYIGGPGTAADAMARIQANLTLTKSSLLPYIRAGYIPTNVALMAASYAGDTSTTDAAGNAWAGGRPGIGAMSYGTSAPPPPPMPHHPIPPPHPVQPPHNPIPKALPVPPPPAPRN